MNKILSILSHCENNGLWQDIEEQRPFIERLIGFKGKNTANEEKSVLVLNSLKLVRSFMAETEKLGIGTIKTHDSLLPGELLTLAFMNELTAYTTDTSRRFELRLSSKATLFELRTLLSKTLKVSFDQIMIQRSSSLNTQLIELDSLQNGLSLQDLHLRNEELLTIKRNQVHEIPQAPLFTSSQELNPALIILIKELFSRFSTNGLMNKDQCARFRGICVNDTECDGNDKKIQELFRVWDDDADGLMTEKNFIEFYVSACKSNPQTVYKNMEAFHYRADFKRDEEIEQEVTLIS